MSNYAESQLQLVRDLQLSITAGEFSKCKAWLKATYSNNDWIIAKSETYICKFIKDSYPIGANIVYIKKETVDNNVVFSFIEEARYYRGMEGRYLNRKSTKTQSKGFATLDALLAHLVAH